MVRYPEVSEFDPALNNILRIFFSCTLLQLLLILNCREVFSLQDTIVVNNDTPEESESRFNPDPYKAAMYSAVLPGMGQIYNRKYWKVPIVYGGFYALTWYALFTHDEYVRYRNAFQFRIDGNPDTVDEFAGDLRYTDDIITRFQDYYRRQRDLTFIFMALFYALNIVDATVDAHLFGFDVGEDLGMKIGPAFQGDGRSFLRSQPGQTFPGIRLRVNF